MTLLANGGHTQCSIVAVGLASLSGDMSCIHGLCSTHTQTWTHIHTSRGAWQFRHAIDAGLPGGQIADIVHLVPLDGSLAPWTTEYRVPCEDSFYYCWGWFGEPESLSHFIIKKNIEKLVRRMFL